MIKANDPKLKSWIEVNGNSEFPIQNIPFGVFKTADSNPKVATRIGDKIIDLNALNDLGYFNEFDLPEDIFDQAYINDFMALGKEKTREIRNKISDIFNIENDGLKNNEEHQNEILYDVKDVEMLMPVKVGDYTDFYSSKEHATNIGIMFRDPKNALMPNWLHIPVGYHGRSSSIVVSGTNVHRPMGQTKADDADAPTFGPCRLFDFELEMAFVVGKETKLGETVTTEKAEDFIFGITLFNDLSARDIQKWEYVPLGPFLSKNFGSVISPWIVTLDAFEPFRTNSPEQNPEPLPYLKTSGKNTFDIDLEVFIQPENAEETKVCHSNFKHLYWSMSQQLAHHTVNGCNINVGDMMASGTISGPTPDSYGSMMEISWKGTKPLKMNDGSERKFILDNDTIIMRGYAEKDGVKIGFGDCTTKILPAKQ